MTDNLEELENRFIRSRDIRVEELRSFLGDLSHFCELSTTGFVRILHPDGVTYSVEDKIQLVLSARLLGNRLQQELKRQSVVSPFVAKSELSEILNTNPKTLDNRLTDLKNKKVIRDVDAKGFQIFPYAIPALIKKLKNREGETH